MFPLFPFGVMLIPLALVAVAGVFLSKHEKERARVWHRWAVARNWAYYPEWPAILPFMGGGPFGRGYSQRVERGFEGTFDQLPVFGFRYRHTTGGGKSRQVHSHLVTGIRFPGAVFPYFRLSREGIFSGRDVRFENDDFNDAWHVVSQSARFAHDVIHPRAMEFLMGPVPPFDALWFHGDMMLATIVGDPDPLRVDAHLRLMTRFADLIPNFVMEELGSSAPYVDGSGPGISVAEQQQRMAAMAAMDAAAEGRAPGGGPASPPPPQLAPGHGHWGP